MAKQILDNLVLTAGGHAEPRKAAARNFLARIARRLKRDAHSFGVALAGANGGVFYQDTPDRLILENVILPFYQLSKDHEKILFVGCDWYTTGYARLFALKSYATIDADRARAKFGAANHQVAPMRNLGTGHRAGSLDLVVCNGVIGWGLNELAEAEASFEAAFMALRPGGHLIIGWNDLPRHLPFKISEIKSLSRFERYVFPPFGADRYRVDHEMRHNFDFFAKP